MTLTTAAVLPCTTSISKRSVLPEEFQKSILFCRNREENLQIFFSETSLILYIIGTNINALLLFVDPLFKALLKNIYIFFLLGKLFNYCLDCVFSVRMTLACTLSQKSQRAFEVSVVEDPKSSANSSEY